MKKFATVALISTAVISSVFLSAFAVDNISKFSSKFRKNFKDCDKYEETVTSFSEGEEYSFNRKIKGWRNGYCQYEETVTSAKGTYKISCNLSHLQMDDLSAAMKDRSKNLEKYELDLYFEQPDAKTGKVKYVKGGRTTIKGNKAFIAWARIQNNPYFCKPEQLR